MTTMRTNFGETPPGLRKRGDQTGVPPVIHKGVRPQEVRKRGRRFVTLRSRSVTESRRHS